MKKYFGLMTVVILLTTFVITAVAQAQVAFESLPDNKSYNDFVVGPGKIEVEMDPGSTQTVNITIANRLGTDKTFSLSLEDFMGSTDPNKTVVLLGDDRGPYSLRDYIRPASSTIVVPQGIRVRVPVTITIPKDAQPGGLYGSVIIGTVSNNTNTTGVEGAIASSPIITRIGTLFFVKVKGAVVQDGKLTDFSLAGKHSVLWGADDIRFNILFKNDGNIHLNPSGTVTITNMLGATVGTIEVEPWFAMPKSLRFREVVWNASFLFGRYTAHASINRGYASTTDEMDTVFWVIPWKIIAIIFIVLIAIVAGMRFIMTRFKISRK